MKLTKILTLSLILSTTTLTAYADHGHHHDYDDHIEAKVYQDVNFDANVAKAVKKLEQKGYTIKEIDVDTHLGKPVLEVEAKKGFLKYDIILSYPDLEILEENID